MKDLEISKLLDLSHTLAADYLSRFVYPWEALSGISDCIKQLGASLPRDVYDHPKDNIWIAKNAKISAAAHIGGPCIIGEGAEVRQGAFIRGSAMVGTGAVVGNSCELKNCILFDGVQVPHFNYVGDSILGYKAHMGAGSVTSNVKSDKTPVTLSVRGQRVALGLCKMGAILGDRVEVGCNAVLNPGTVIGRDTSVYPLTAVRGFIPEAHIVKSMDNIVAKKINR
jgi:NDP-sugar pyrophosphorylase family protein